MGGPSTVRFLLRHLVRGVSPAIIFYLKLNSLIIQSPCLVTELDLILLWFNLMVAVVGLDCCGITRGNIELDLILLWFHLMVTVKIAVTFSNSMLSLPTLIFLRIMFGVLLVCMVLKPIFALNFEIS